MKIIFMGTPDFAVPALKALILSRDHLVVAVFTQSPKPKDRGHKVQPSPTHQLAEAHNIPVFIPKTLRSKETIELIHDIEADVIVVVAYGFIVPFEILNAKRYGCLNIHPSLLPKLRGAAPLQRTIINGEKNTGVCIIKMDEGVDTGDILACEEFIIDDDITFKTLHDKCAELGAQLLLKTLKAIDHINPAPQDHSKATHAPKLAKAESLINWNDSAFSIYCKIRGMNPWPGTYFLYQGQPIKILRASYSNEINSFKPGYVIDDSLTIACGIGSLKILELQKPGKNKMPTSEFQKGSKIEKGALL